MTLAVTGTIDNERPVIQLTRAWGDWASVSLFLNRCQIDTPRDLIELTWSHVKLSRQSIGKVIDFGAGDARFSKGGEFHEYLGYEIDEQRCSSLALPDNVQLINRCAFSDEISDADLCIGNPPFVRNQDLPLGWRQHAANVLYRRTHVSISGLANAWQYFFLLALASLKEDGLSALIVPYEWVSRPSARALRDYIEQHNWHVKVYRLSDTRFRSVLTTSSITIVDKAKRDGIWEYFEETSRDGFTRLTSPRGAPSGILAYVRRKDIPSGAPRAMRGLSPGTQRVLTLTEGERIRNGLQVGRDVVPCVTSLRLLPQDCVDLDNTVFQHYFRDKGIKCWLVRTDRDLSSTLSLYLQSIPTTEYQTATCLERDKWWNFKMPPLPQMLFAQSFKQTFPKRVKNTVQARAVGSVCGIYNVTDEQVAQILDGFGGMDLRPKVVAHSNGFRKIEINQLNKLFSEIFGPYDTKT